MWYGYLVCGLGYACLVCGQLQTTTLAEFKPWNVDMATIDGSTEEVFIDYNDSQQVLKFKTEPSQILEWITRHQAFDTSESLQDTESIYIYRGNRK